MVPLPSLPAANPLLALVCTHVHYHSDAKRFLLRASTVQKRPEAYAHPMQLAATLISIFGFNGYESPRDGVKDCQVRRGRGRQAACSPQLTLLCPG